MHWRDIAFVALASFVPASACAGSDDAATQKPQSRAPSVNAAAAVGADEPDGPTILDSVPAFAGLDHARDVLRDTYGIYLRGNYIGDPYADLGGGLRAGATYAGRLDIEVDADAEKIAGLSGGTLHANMFQIHGRDLSKDFIGNLLSINDIAARPTTRLYELWYEQTFGDAFSVRVGQIGIDVEFLTSNYAANFINATFGWPGLPSIDLPQGGPAYPLATPAVRVKSDPTANLSILAAIFDGEPAGPGAGDPQARDRYGLNFRVSDPPLVFVEAQYRYNQVKAGVEPPTGLPGTIKLGGFAHFGSFPDQRLATDGAPLTTAAGAPLEHSGDGGVYGIIDQQIYRAPGDDPRNGIGIFARLIVAPDDRNPVNLYADAGVTSLGLIPGRPDDLFGIAAAFANISPSAQAFDREVDAASGVAAPVRGFEALIELTYQAQVIPGIALQPTFQYVIHPGGGIADPTGNGLAPIRNAKVFGVTSVVRF